jgi:cytidylate kinase
MIIHIAIDGPAGAGKSTIAKKIAERLGITYIDTGAMYRALTWKLLNETIDLSNEKLIINITKKTKMEIDQDNIFIDSQNLKDEIRKPLISQNVSKVARIPEVRNIMVDIQRKISQEKSIVMDGRDIGTHVLPNANYKFFLTASIDERAHRRAIELNKQGFKTNINDIREEIKQRDKIDTERKASPLKPAKNAIIIDTTYKSINTIINEIMNIILKGG